jgi:hypothetical protein
MFEGIETAARCIWSRREYSRHFDMLRETSTANRHERFQTSSSSKE